MILLRRSCLLYRYFLQCMQACHLLVPFYHVLLAEESDCGSFYRKRAHLFHVKQMGSKIETTCFYPIVFSKNHSCGTNHNHFCLSPYKGFLAGVPGFRGYLKEVASVF